ncbi:uncharacterized protein MISP3 [Dermochelys coriacea]|uniref:uncharacterized protein MISP3 n=1 Tax=Dermochelys coriacea TaxID=27794 RepID=UPI001CA82CCF|nr:uncharacterized protein MISP3 [Dermochelys coriacea]
MFNSPVCAQGRGGAPGAALATGSSRALAVPGCAGWRLAERVSLAQRPGINRRARGAPGPSWCSRPGVRGSGQVGSEGLAPGNGDAPNTRRNVSLESPSLALMATEAVSLPPSAPEECQGDAPTGLCPAGEGMDVPGKEHRPGEGGIDPVIAQEREPGAPKPPGTTGQDEAPTHGQSPAASGEEGNQADHRGACPTPPVQPHPADASGQPACGGENSNVVFGDPPDATPSSEPPQAANVHGQASPGEPKLSASSEQGCQESTEAAGTETGEEKAPSPHGDKSPATSPGSEQPAEESEKDPRLAGEQGPLTLGRAGAQGGQDASCPLKPDGMPVPGGPLLAPGDLAPCSQQGAAGARPEAAVPRSPVATGDSSGPAHLASDGSWEPGGGEGQREGPAGSSAGGAGDNNKPRGEVGAGAVVESEPNEVPPSAAGPRETSPGGDGAREPDGAEDLGGAAGPTDTRDLTGTKDPASPPETAGATDLASEDPAAPSDRGSAAAPTGADTQTSAGDPTGAKDPGAASEQKGESMENGDPSSDGEASPALKLGSETPIEREIRLHQEREETLRRQRGLASSRDTQQYVEVRMKPILSQAQPPAQLPKEKERQWAGAQMQREIQRERLREEDLMQLGKVRGTYDRGTHQELQEKKMLFEQQPNPEPPSPRKPARVTCGSSAKTPRDQGPRGPSFAEANSRANMVILEPSTLLRPSLGRQATLERSPSAQGNPFFRLRSRSPQSRLELEVQEAQKREQELQKQRHSLYGWDLPGDAQWAADGEEPRRSRPERPSCGKLDVTWPPRALLESPQENGLDQVEKSPRSLRQKSALIQRWESGAVSNPESQE